jgi:hypothetical protein
MTMDKKPFTITPTNKKLLKSAAVRKWLRDVEAVVKAKMEENKTAWWIE